MTVDPWVWVATGAFILLLLALDLFVFHRKPHAVSVREATVLSGFYVAVGLLFGVAVLVFGGATAGGEYFTGYLLEKALSVDNIFVFALVFAYFAVPAELQHRVLFWGVLGALVLRGIFIVLGAELLETYDWVVFLFGTILVITGVRMALHRGDDQVDPGRNPVLRAMRRAVPISDRFEGARFWVRAQELPAEERERMTRRPLLGAWVATPLLAVLVVVETTDVVFAVDSIPAIFAITTDTFIVFTSNAFAILGLRALYFVLKDALDRFAYLQMGLALILVFIGLKFFYGELVGKVPVTVSLPFIATVLAIAIGASLWRTRGGDDGSGGRSGADEPRVAEPAREEVPA